MSRPTAVRASALSFAVAVLVAISPAAGQLRVATWNVTNYYGTDRAADIQTVMYGTFEGRSLAPDIILVQEFMSASAMTTFRDLLNTAPGSPGDWDGRWVNGPSGQPEGSAFFFRTSKVIYQGYLIVSQGGSPPNPPRHAVRFKVQLQGYTSQKAVLCCYNSHMKAGTTADDQARRLVEAQRIRDNAELLNPDWHFLLGADLNMYSSSEAAYQELVGDQANNAGRFFDPINTPGTWHDGVIFRFVHTQDPVASNGGMDDRFDQILVSADLIDGDGLDYIGNPTIPYSTTTWNDGNHSYRAWGNDGSSFNQGLRVTGNTMVGPTIAQALVNAAASGGHLPVFLDLRVPAKIDSDTTLDFGQVPLNSTAEQILHVWNAGDCALWSAGGIDTLRYSLTATAGFTAPSGQFAAAPCAAPDEHIITMDTSSLGSRSGTVTITSNAPDEPVRTVTLVGEVVLPAGCPGDTNCDGSVTFADIEWFVEALAGQANWSHDPCPWDNADTNGDGDVTYADIDSFVALIGTTCP